VLNFETNQKVDTCEVTFEERQPRSSLVFDCAIDDELSEEIFQEEEDEHGDDEDGGVAPATKHLPTTSTTIDNGPSPTPTMTSQDQGEAVAEGEVATRREPPWRVQVDHPISRIIRTSTNTLRGRGFGTTLTFPMLLLLLLMSPKTLDTHYLITIG
jgi:hypothetical protein